MTIRVKPLEWREDKSLLDRMQWKAGDYTICRMVWSQEITVYDTARGHWLCSKPVGTLDKAKAAAQADYEQRVLAAIEVSDDPR